MAIIASTENKANVTALGGAMSANVSLSGALMEMLSTVYKHILLAATREAIQNGCDAARRAGLTFADGVLVKLPTESDPLLTVVDQGSGMTKEFMQTTYLGFGCSTKSKDNGSAGGLGVGRWAAYGYIRECYITTCHASDMIDRTYFQFQGEDGKPHVQLASEAPGKVVGTKVFFPVKKEDIAEVYRVVAWLKEVMQLTMGDSFSVEGPALPSVLPAFAGTCLNLEDVDPSLKGVKVYPMQDSKLQYGESGAMVKGSLVVLTNQDQGVGGLPFHVSTSATASVFAGGMIIEIPMSYELPFMPSREELKYNSDVYALFKRIDDAALTAFLQQLKTFKEDGKLQTLSKINGLLGSGDTVDWHYWATANCLATETETKKQISAVIGHWNGKASLVYPDIDRDLRINYTASDSWTMKTVYKTFGRMGISDRKDMVSKIEFRLDNPIILVLNDLNSGGMSRFRLWMRKDAPSGARAILITHKDLTVVERAVHEVNKAFGHELPVVRTSTMGEAPKVVVGTRVRKASVASTLTFHSFVEDKQNQEIMDATTALKPGEKLRVWVGKDGGKLAGFDKDTQLSGLVACGLKYVFQLLGVHKLYFFNKKQEKAFLDTVADATADGVFDDEVDTESSWNKEEISALRSWVSFEDFLKMALDSVAVQEVLAGKRYHSSCEPHAMKMLCDTLAKKPRMELVGTSFDKYMAPHMDLLSGAITIHYHDFALSQVCNALKKAGESMEVTDTDSEDRKAFIESLSYLSLVGTINYAKIKAELIAKYPVLSFAFAVGGCNMGNVAWDDFWVAFSKLYP